jgi:P27 family predicted phage terminase small subunit
MTHLRGVKPMVHQDHDPLPKAPQVPSYFSSFAKAEWKRIMPQLISRQIITKADLGGVEEYCLMRGVVRQLEVERKQSGGVIDPKLFNVQNRAAQTARQLAAEYGLSPVSRSRIGSSAADDDDDNPLAV